MRSTQFIRWAIPALLVLYFALRITFPNFYLINEVFLYNLIPVFAVIAIYSAPRFNDSIARTALSLAICNSLHFENLSINFFHYTWALAQIFSIKILRFAADRGLLQTGVCCRLGFVADWGLQQTGVCCRLGFAADRGLLQTEVCSRLGFVADWGLLQTTRNYA